jgi:hypothetical protein
MAALLALRFLAELGMLLCLGVGGWRVGDSTLTSVIGAVVLPVAAMAVWGRWVAPRASHRLPDPARLAVEVALFAAAGIAVVTAERPMSLVGIAVWVAFLLSVPSRGHEPALAQSGADRTGL